MKLTIHHYSVISKFENFCIFVKYTYHRFADNLLTNWSKYSAGMSKEISYTPHNFSKAKTGNNFMIFISQVAVLFLSFTLFFEKLAMLS